LPYIDMNISCQTSKESIEKVQKEIVDTISSKLGKGKDSIMTHINLSEYLYLGYEKLDNGAILELSSFGKSDTMNKQKIYNEVTKILKKHLGTSEENVYMIFSDRTEWGYKGNFLG